MARLPHTPYWFVGLVFVLTIIGSWFNPDLDELFKFILTDGLIALGMIIFYNLVMKALSIWEKKITGK